MHRDQYPKIKTTISIPSDHPKPSNISIYKNKNDQSVSVGFVTVLGMEKRVDSPVATYRRNMSTYE